MQPRFHRGVLREQPPRPGKRTSSSLMPREKKGNRLVAELFIRHPRTVLVLRVKEHGKQVSGIMPGGAAFADDAIENTFDKRNLALDAKIGGGGHPMRHEQCAPEIGAKLEQQLEGLSDVLRVPRDIGIKECFGHDLKS